ncbi:MAG TPA: exonuclease domain-containing protein, partial [Symbiobacteriaceae bacterium]|nr:exonuclease domain-containing protein [Symbiobacteriaceae bacterium]
MSPQTDWLGMIDRTSLPADVQTLLDDAKLQRVEVRQRAREVTLHLQVPRRMPLAVRESVAAQIATACFTGLPVTVRVVPRVASPPPDPQAAVAAAWDEAILQARTALPRLNGIVDKAQPRLEGQVLRVEVPTEAMVAVVEGCGGAARIEEMLCCDTGLTLTVRFETKPKPVKVEQPQAESTNLPADPFADVHDDAPPPPEPPSNVDPAKEFLDQYVTDWMQRQSAFGKKEAGQGGGAAVPSEGPLKGRNINGDAPVRDIRTITEEENRVLIEGEVVGVDSRDTKTGKQMISFAVCDLLRINKPGDLGDTLPVKVFRDPTKDPDYLQVIKNGAWLKVRGNVQLDKFSGELTMLADDIVTGKRPARMDTYAGPLKRVELHAHTLMSSMDGMIDPEELVKRAIKWGHRAVAVTDHGVTQAFPAATHVKLPEGFKLLFGCEFYLVDDGTPIIVRPPHGVPMAEADFVVLDIETTGFSPIGDDIIEVGAVRYKNGVIGETFQRFVRPSKPIPEEVQKLTSITPDMVANAPLPAEALREFFDFIGDAIIVAHNAQFDYSFLRYHRHKHLGEEFTNPVLDTLILGRSLMPHMKSHSLSALTKELQVVLVDHHRADADAKTAAMVMAKLLDKAPHIETVEQLNDLTQGMNVEQLRPYHVTCL